MHRYLAVLLGLAGIWLAASSLVAGRQRDVASAPAPNRQLLDTCCVTCHDDRLRTAGLTLQSGSRPRYRRPVTPEDVDALLGFYRAGPAADSFDAGLDAALQRLLVRPDFLFRIELDPDGARAPYRISELGLASRLSFFLWSSIPDDELLDLAVHDELRHPATLERQVRRMLADRRARALVVNFAAEWLQLRDLRTVVPDPDLFPEWDESLREAFRQETELFIEDQLRADRSVILDSVTARIAELRQRLGARDRAKLSEYVDAVRDIERRIRKAEEQSGRELPVVGRPGGIPSSFEAHVKLMFDLQVLAYQTDLTRVMTFMLGRELSGRTFPELGVVESHHATSHHQENAGKIANLLKIKIFHSNLFAYYLERLRATSDGDGSLLDHTLLVYGAGMGDSNLHAPGNLPVLLAGGAAGRLRTGRHVRHEAGTPLANLHLSLLDMFGVPTVERMGDSTGRLEHLGI